MDQPNHLVKTIAYRKIIDLSHVIHPQIPRWPGDPEVAFSVHANLETDGFYLRQMSIGEHSATHINAPNTFDPQGASIDMYSADSLVVSAVVIDIRDRAAIDPDYQLTIADIHAWEAQYQMIPAQSIVLLFTGWQEKWDDPIAFLNQDAIGGLHFPGFSGEATEFLLEQRAIGGVGSDAHGVDPGNDQHFTTNQLVLKRGGLVLENLTNLDQLPAQGATLAIGILRLQSGSGSPVSVLAFVP